MDNTIKYTKDFFIGQLSNGDKDLHITEIDTPIKKVTLHNNFNDVFLDYHWHMESGVLMIAVAKPVTDY